MKDNLLNVREVAEYLHVSERSVLRYIEVGKLKASKVGSWRIKPSDLENFLKKTGNIKGRRRYG